MSQSPVGPLCSIDWLKDHLADPKVRLLDASWHMPATGRNARAEFEAGHIPGAQFFDIDGIAADQDLLPHMAAPPERFARLIGQLGVSQSDVIVVYDSIGLFSAARAWWNLKIMGAQDVYVLDGGLPRWQAAGGAIVGGADESRSAAFIASPLANTIRTADEVRALLDAENVQVVDVRSAGRFSGADSEPRAGLSSGHMPGALNLPFPELISDGRLKSADQLREVFAKAGVDPDQPIVATCGSGVTAPLLCLALAAMGKPQLSVYDGSWTEWASRGDLPIVKDC